MKRYYDENGEPDVAKTLWAFLTKCLWGLALFCGICIVWNSTHQPQPADKTPHWSNWDNRPLSEVKWYNYREGIIHYRGEDPCNIPRDFKFKPSGGGYSGDGIVLQVDGASVHLNMTAEELLDQLTEDADFYEYFERNMD